MLGWAAHEAAEVNFSIRWLNFLVRRPAIEPLVPEYSCNPVGDLRHLGFGYGSLNAHLLGFPHYIGRERDRTEQYGQIGFHFGQFASRVETVHAWHHKVQQQHIGVQLASSFDSFTPVDGFSTYIPVAGVLNQVAQSAPHHCIIVDDKNSFHDLA